MPLIVHSIWRTPPWMAAMLFATARPRSSWQCALKIARSAFGTRAEMSLKNAQVFGRGVADGVRQVDRRRAGGDGRLDDAAQEIAIAARGVLRRKLHIVGELPGAADPVDDLLEARLARDAQLALEVQIRGREERVDARPLGRLERARRFLDVLRPAAGQRRDHRAPHLGRNLPRRFGIGRRRDREAGLDDVDAERVERPGQRQLGGHVHREAGRLLAVAERRVEDDDAGGYVAHDVLL